MVLHKVQTKQGLAQKIKRKNFLIYIYLNQNKKQAMSSNDESLKLFLKEFEKIEKSIDGGLQNIEKISLAQIVELYYQVINVNSLVKYSQNINEGFEGDFRLQITNTQKYVEEKFNQNLHPQILTRIDELIESTKNDLKQIQNQNQKTKEEIENQAQKYEELRKMMSTKEFVEQYNKIIGK